MFDWDKYSSDVLLAYGVGIALIVLMISVILIQSLRVKRRLAAVQSDD